jgi:hypothetical protein
MKNFSLYLAVFIVAFICGNTTFVSADTIYDPVPGTGSYDVLPNGDFETGDKTNWDNVWPTRGVFVTSNEEAFDGTYSAKTETYTTSGDGYALIQYNVSVSEGQDFVLSGFFHTEGLSQGNFYLDMDDAAFEIHVLATLGQGWHFVWETISIPMGVNSVNVRLVRSSDRSPTDRGYIDEVALTPAGNFEAPSPVPEPATLALLAAGALGLLGYGWKHRRLG